MCPVCGPVADQVDGAMRKDTPVSQRQNWIGQIDDKKIVLFFDIGTEQQWAGTIDREFPAGNKARAFVEDPLVLEAERADVAVPIEDAEGVGVFKNSSAGIGYGRIRPNIILALDLNDIAHRRKK